MLNCIAMKKRALGEVKEARLALFQVLRKRIFFIVRVSLFVGYL